MSEVYCKIRGLQEELPHPIQKDSPLLLDEVIEWIQGEPDYQLIEFDPTSARGYAQSLVDLGHPEWEGRMSGTIEEHNTADFIKANFTSMGIPSTLEDFDVPMFVIDDEPELGICHAGDVGQTLPAFACGCLLYTSPSPRD